jgi:ureidoacrylate peracid hydrolase
MRRRDPATRIVVLVVPREADMTEQAGDHADTTDLVGAPAPIHPDGTPVEESGDGSGGGASFDPATTAVVVIDVQRLFTDLLGVPVVPPLEEVLPNMTRFLDDARAAGATVVLVRTIISPEDHSRNTLTWPDFMRANLAPGSPGTEWDPAVAPQAGDIEVIKQRYSGFFGTPLDAILRERGISTVIVFGITTNVCVQTTVRDSWQHDYRTITLADCCSEMGEGLHESSLAWNARNFGEVYTSEEVMAGWRSRVAG